MFNFEPNNMKTRIYFILTLLFGSFNAYSAESSGIELFKGKNKKLFSERAVGLGFGQNSTIHASFWTQTPLKYKNFQTGVGVRLTRKNFENPVFITAPAILSKGSDGFSALFKPNVGGNLDSFMGTGSSSQFCINLGFSARYFLKSLFLKSTKLYAEVNFDLTGVSFASNTTGNLIHNGKNSATNGLAPKYNLFKLGDNNLGSLNSEFLLKARFLKKLMVYGGYTLMMNEIRTETATQLQNGITNDRFRNRSQALVFGFQWIFSK